MPKAPNYRVRTMRSGAWASRATERQFRALHENASPHARPTRPTRAHYLGYIIRVVAHGRCYAGGMFWGAIHPEMGRRNGALCTLPDFPMRLSHEPGLWIQYIININMEMSGRPLLGTSEQRRVLGTSDQITPPHTHTRTLRCTARSSTGFLLDCGAPTSMMHLRTKPGVIPSFLTVLRAEPRCRRTENRFIETRRNETDSYRKWEQGGPWWMCKGAWVKGTKTQVAARPKLRNWEDRF